MTPPTRTQTASQKPFATTAQVACGCRIEQNMELFESQRLPYKLFFCKTHQAAPALLAALRLLVELHDLERQGMIEPETGEGISQAEVTRRWYRAATVLDKTLTTIEGGR